MSDQGQLHFLVLTESYIYYSIGSTCRYMPVAVRNVEAAILNNQLILNRYLTNVDASPGLSPRFRLLRSQARPEPTSRLGLAQA